MLALLLPLRAARDPAGFRADARTPAALTAAVATAVLGSRLTSLGWAWAGIATLVITLVLWAALLGPVLAGWKSPTVGVSLLLAVSAESLAVLAATLAAPEHARWLLIAALVPFGVGLGLYVFVISRFDFHQLAVGRGDHWITGGALGIAALAAGRIAAGAKMLDILGGGGGVYAACSFAVAGVAHAGAITSFARVWVWIGFASWAIVSVTTIGHAVEVVRGDGPPDGGTQGPTAEERPPHPGLADAPS